MAAQTVSGTWRRTFVGYSGAEVWGTGINPIHGYYGSDALRLTQYPVRAGEITPPWQAVPDQLQAEELWGYTSDHSTYVDVEYGDRPNWSEPPNSFRSTTQGFPSWSAPGRVTEAFRTLFKGSYRKFRGHSQAYSDIQYVVPSETVTEGWRNKPKGSPANAKPSDNDQLIIQTSMTQRYQTRTNQAAVMRGTDPPREGIASKVTGQRLKIYSGGERHYDMYPKEQDLIPRPFWYRTAGTGRPTDMVPNTMWSISALERIPPQDPSMGIPETEFQNDFGYTTEDTQYYG